MVDFQKPIPSYLNEKQNILRLILFTSLFALIFINFYSPFGSGTWFNVTRLQFFTYSSLIILTGVLVVVISRVIMYQVSKRNTILLWHYLLWIFAEVLSMALSYAAFEKFLLSDSRMFSDLVKISSRNTALVLLLPYSVSWLYFSWRDKKEQIDRLADGHAVPAITRNMISFYDEKGTLKFSVKKENLLYLEAAENYVSICYLSKDKVSRYLLRETLKKIEETFSGDEIVRCHRSYMVNFEKIKVIRRDRDGLKLGFDNPQVIDIPVSKTYVNTVMETFSKYYQTVDIS
jgi:hypothetical protein